ncbi:MAG: chorismate mutase [Flavobacteriaceae bacterium]|jgi:isochorismate pyruvate lyase|nr:chorismate mutase [Flavobacteriaceae bacterium]
MTKSNKDKKHCSTLDEIRQNIDRIDEELIKLISERSFYVDQAVKFNKTRNLAKNENINPDIVEKIYRVMISAFIEQEKKKLNQ